MFTEIELKDIYNKHVVKNKAYFNKYTSVPPCPVKSWKNGWKGKDAPRCFTILDFIEWTKKYNLTTGDILGTTCKTDPEIEFINYTQFIELNYPPYDLHKHHEIFNNTFDFFIFNQTIEHLYNPFLVIEHIFKYIKPGGFVFTSVPTINIPHSTPIHFNGYNPMGLAMLFKCAGFEIMEIGQWGNEAYIAHIFKTHGWPDVHTVGCKNEEINVAQCWILAKKV